MLCLCVDKIFLASVAYRTRLAGCFLLSCCFFLFLFTFCFLPSSAEIRSVKYYGLTGGVVVYVWSDVFLVAFFCFCACVYVCVCLCVCLFDENELEYDDYPTEAYMFRALQYIEKGTIHT